MDPGPPLYLYNVVDENRVGFSIDSKCKSTNLLSVYLLGSFKLALYTVLPYFFNDSLVSPVGSSPCLFKCIPKIPTPACASVDNGVYIPSLKNPLVSVPTATRDSRFCFSANCTPLGVAIYFVKRTTSRADRCTDINAPRTNPSPYAASGVAGLVTTVVSLGNGVWMNGWEVNFPSPYLSDLSVVPFSTYDFNIPIWY